MTTQAATDTSAADHMGEAEEFLFETATEADQAEAAAVENFDPEKAAAHAVTATESAAKAQAHELRARLAAQTDEDRDFADAAAEHAADAARHAVRARRAAAHAIARRNRLAAETDQAQARA